MGFFLNRPAVLPCSFPELLPRISPLIPCICLLSIIPWTFLISPRLCLGTKETAYSFLPPKKPRPCCRVSSALARQIFRPRSRHWTQWWRWDMYYEPYQNLSFYKTRLLIAFWLKSTVVSNQGIIPGVLSKSLQSAS